MFGIINNNGEWFKWIDSKTGNPVFSANIKAGQVFFKRKKISSVNDMIEIIKQGFVKEIPDELLLGSESSKNSNIKLKQIMPPFIDPYDDLSDSEYLFRELNEKCLRCIKNCKQSAKAEILACPQYKTR